MGIVDKVTAEIKIEFPAFRIIKKSESMLMKIINIFLITMTFGQMRTFMSGFITTVGNTVYVPHHWDKKSEESVAEILRHERVHMRQSRKYSGFVFAILYLFVPLPFGFAYFRAKFEMEAYEESMKAIAEYIGVQALSNPHVKESIVKNFVGPYYAWMYPFRARVEKWYDEVVDRIKKNEERS